MDRIWAPWRIQYILGIKPEDKARSSEEDPCVLCALRKSEPEKDRGNLLLHRGEHSIIMMNLYPYNSGHLMFVPNTHTGDFEQLSGDETAEIMSFAQRMIPVFKKVMNPDGYNLGINLGRVAGAGIIDHVHLHLVPRWNGDANFMPVIGETKVISDHIEMTYDRLLKGMKEAGFD